jgi:ribonuclease HII
VCFCYGHIIAGVDEAGRGPWAGPVISAAVILNQDNYPEGLNDSKKLSAAKREKLFHELKQCAKIGVGIATVEEIDTINILNATKLSMVRAIKNLPSRPETVLVDGNQKIDFPANIITVVKGDSKSLSIAAASIIAKVTRDQLMRELHGQFPMYAWDRNAGYGTKQHQEAITQHGITDHHRKSFSPIKRALML